MGYHSTQIQEGFYAIDEGLVRCYLLIGTNIALLIDTCASGGEAFVSQVKALTDKPVQVVLTHADPDHTGGCSFSGRPLFTQQNLHI